MTDDPSAATPLAVAETVMPVSPGELTTTCASSTSPATTVTGVVTVVVPGVFTVPAVPDGKTARIVAVPPPVARTAQLVARELVTFASTAQLVARELVTCVSPPAASSNMTPITPPSETVPTTSAVLATIDIATFAAAPPVALFTEPTTVPDVTEGAALLSVPTQKIPSVSGAATAPVKLNGVEMTAAADR